MEGTNTIGVWVAVIAVAVTIQTLVLAVFAVVAWRAYRRGVNAIDAYRRTQLDPLFARARTSLDEVHEVTERVRAARRWRAAGDGPVGTRTADAMSLVRGRSWQTVALIRGLGAVVRALSSTMTAIAIRTPPRCGASIRRRNSSCTELNGITTNSIAETSSWSGCSAGSPSAPRSGSFSRRSRVPSFGLSWRTRRINFGSARPRSTVAPLRRCMKLSRAGVRPSNRAATQGPRGLPRGEGARRGSGA